MRHVAHSDSGQHTEHRGGHRRGQFGQACLERTVAADQLEVLRQEEHQTRKPQHREEIGHHDAGEHGAAEQPDVDQRDGQAQLAAHEQRQRGGAEQCGQHRIDPDAMCGGRDALLDRVDDAQHADHGQADARQIPRPRFGVAVFGQQHQPADDQDDHRRDVDQEHRAPPEVFQQNTSDHRSECRAGRERRRPDADGDAAFALVREQPADQRQGGRSQRGTGQSQQGAGGDEHLRRRRVRRDGRNYTEKRCTAEQQLLVSDAVAQTAHADEQRSQHEGVDVADPQQLGAAG